MSNIKITISEMKNDLVFIENKKEVRMKGYAFLDQYDNCQFIVYGEARKKAYMKYFKMEE
jgi:hypothetical protein